MVTAFPPPAASSQRIIDLNNSNVGASTLGNGTQDTSSAVPQLPVLDLSLLINPPYTSAAAWTTFRMLMITTDTAWPSQQQVGDIIAKHPNNSIGGQVSEDLRYSCLFLGLYHILGQLKSAK
jgi:hypothetical protein